MSLALSRGFLLHGLVTVPQLEIQDSRALEHHHTFRNNSRKALYSTPAPCDVDRVSCRQSQYLLSSMKPAVTE
ncbi:hypothetical protein HD806DRAFT_164486 [Xylariaceae sp. AK1471]|nr:hypothetical protein HD806DRAFT_164486 [Xylariaceae sp. AK1471]